VTSLKQRLVQLFEQVLVVFWRRRDPVQAPPVVTSISLPENVQCTMNLVMPLADPTAAGRAIAVQAVGSVIDELFTGLNSVGTVHVARFDIVDGNLCMFSVYDGDFTSYIRDFISLFGNVFDQLMHLVKDPPPLPSERNPEAFIEWVHRHDAIQIPGDLTALFPEEDDLRDLPRDLVVLLDAHPNVQIGVYRGYPGHSVAQVRDGLGVGW
jgi:hypothetical protein